MTKVSFICPVYNKRHYLPNVLKSIKEQTGNYRKEYLFIDDGSTDNSLNYIREHTKEWKNCKIFSQSNKGPASATQKGIEHSTGDYVKLVGGDDIMSPNCTEILLESIIKTSSIAAFSKYSLYKKFSEIKFKNEKIKNLSIIKDPLTKTIQSNYSGTTPNLYSKDAIEKSGGCYKNLFIEDFSLVLRISKFGTFCFIDNLTSYGPKEDKNRIMLGSKNQLLHDFNAAIYYFLIENKNLNKKIKKIACIKCLGRAEKWYRRELSGTVFSKINFKRLRYYLFSGNEEQLIKSSCQVFYQKQKKNMRQIRYKLI